LEVSTASLNRMDVESWIMSVQIHVEAYSGFKANERPRSFSLNPTIGENGVEDVHDIDAVEDRWYDPNAEYFRIRADRRRYLLPLTNV